MAIIKTLNSSKTISPRQQIVGTLEAITDEGVALVDFSGNDAGLLEAKSTLSAADVREIGQLPREVMLSIGAVGEQPIITGLVSETLFDLRSSDSEHAFSTRVDGKNVVLEADQEILLKCGKSSLLLRRDGKVVIKGTNLISRSTGANKIKGSSININ